MPDTPPRTRPHGTWMIRFWDADHGQTEAPYAAAPFRATCGFVFCSECRTDALCNRLGEDEPSPYCPHCGLPMKEELP